MSQRFELITFDLDDTLWDVRPVLERAERRLAEWIGEHCPALAQRFDRKRWLDLRFRLLAQRPELQHRISELRAESMRLAMLECGYAAQEASALAADAFAVFIAARHEVELFAAVEQCLEHLAQDHVLGVLTNGNADVFRLPLGRFFRFALRAEELGVSKPEPASFAAALAAAGTTAERAIHVGDHHEHDMLGAQRLGITAVWFNQDARAWPGGQPPALQFDCFEKLPALIASLAQDSPD